MTDDFRFLSAIADQLLLERGEYDPFEFLLSAGYLDDEDYRDWRHCRIDELQSALLCDVDDAIEALTGMQAYVMAQQLTLEVRTPTSWDKESRELRVGVSKALTKLCGTYLVRPSTRMQADLFHDSTNTVVANAVCNALAEHRLDEARDALGRLQKLVGSTPEVNGYWQLLQLIDSTPPTPADRLREIEEVVTPLAARYLTQRARDYLAPLWQALARRLSKAAFAPEQPKLHASYANAQARRWKRVVETIEAEQDWDKHATLMARLAEAYSRLSRKSEARRTWSKLCWAHGDVAAVMLAASCDPLLTKLWLEFSELDEELTAQDFPAWLLLADLRQRQDVPGHLAPDNDAGRVYAATARLVQSDGAIEARTVLNASRPALLRQFLNRRSAAG